MPAASAGTTAPGAPTASVVLKPDSSRRAAATAQARVAAEVTAVRWARKAQVYQALHHARARKGRACVGATAAVGACACTCAAPGGYSGARQWRFSTGDAVQDGVVTAVAVTLPSIAVGTNRGTLQLWRLRRREDGRSGSGGHGG